LIRNYFSRIVYKTVQIISGEKPPKRIIDSVLEAKDTKFLFIAAGGVKDEIEFNTFFVNAAGKKADLWVVPEVGHTGAFSAYPIEYKNRVLDFFTEWHIGFQY
jgi:hypothetical protein